MSLIRWLLDDQPQNFTQPSDYEIKRLIDSAYCQGAKNEREAILGILDRLIPKFVKVNISVARRARAEIPERNGNYDAEANEAIKCENKDKMY